MTSKQRVGIKRPKSQIKKGGAFHPDNTTQAKFKNTWPGNFDASIMQPSSCSTSISRETFENHLLQLFAQRFQKFFNDRIMVCKAPEQASGVLSSVYFLNNSPTQFSHQRLSVYFSSFYLSSVVRTAATAKIEIKTVCILSSNQPQL